MPTGTALDGPDPLPCSAAEKFAHTATVVQPAYITTMSTLAQNIIALIGLGVAIDYALLIVTRWREERSRGRTNRDAVVAA